MTSTQPPSRPTSAAARLAQSLLPPDFFEQAECAGVVTRDYDPFNQLDSFEYVERAFDYRAARACCNACPIRLECLDWAMRTEQRHGMWGATTPDERADIERGRRSIA